MTHLKRAILAILFLTVFSFVLYSDIFSYRSFDPEFPLFYFYADGLSFRQTLTAYTYTSLMWYRPTAHSLSYWLGQKLFDWHDLIGWRLYHFWTVLFTVYAIYWLVCRHLGGSALAGVLTAAYFAAQPSLYAFVMNASAFDFLHILFAVLCSGCYFGALRSTGTRTIFLTSLSWVFFLAAITSKEVTLVIPFYLMVAAALVRLFEKRAEPLSTFLRREIFRLLPFVAVLPAYYFWHLVKVPPDAFGASGPYRGMANWNVIAANLRKLSLWLVRVYGYTGETTDQRMFQSTALNNLAGIASLALVVALWIRKTRLEPSRRATALLLIAWVASFLAMPVFAGGYIWHVNLPLVGYSALFGLAAAWGFESIAATACRRAAVAAFLLSMLLLGRENLRVELREGVHATAYRINHSLLVRPPAPADRLGKTPLVYIEDRLNLGPWWYGCFGKLFNFVYRRHDIEEVVVPSLAAVPEGLRKTWASRPSAFFFRYDAEFNWSDASAEFRAVIDGKTWSEPGAACTGASDARRDRAPIRINAGGPAILDSSGAMWERDAYYDGGQTYSTQASIAGALVPELYRSERFHDRTFRYRICVPNGTYRVRLKFAEIWFTAEGRRVFNVLVNGKRALVNLDIAREAGGPNRALDREFRQVVTGGAIDVQFEPVVSNPKISAIEIIPVTH